MGTVAPVSDGASAARDDGHAMLARDAHGGGDVRGGLGVDQRLRTPDHVRGVARHGGELGRLGVHALAERRLQRRDPRFRHAATMRGTALSKHTMSRSMRPSARECPRARAAVAARRPAVSLPIGAEHAVATQPQAPEARHGLRGEARERRVERSRVGPTGQRERTALREVGGRRRATGRAERALERAHERLRILECDARPVREGQLATGFGVGGIDGGAQRSRGRPAAAEQRALQARARGAEVCRGRQRQAERVAGPLGARLEAGGGVDSRQHERDPAAVGVPVRPQGQLTRRHLRERAGELAGLESAFDGTRDFKPAGDRNRAGLAQQRESISERAPAAAEVGQPLLVALEPALCDAHVGAVTAGGDLEAQHAPVGRLELHAEHAAGHQLDDRTAEVERGVVQAARRWPVRKGEAPRAALAHVGDRALEQPAPQIGPVRERTPDTLGRGGDAHALIDLDRHRALDRNDHPYRSPMSARSLARWW